MNRKLRVIVGFLALLALLALVDLCGFRSDGWTRTATSYGTVPSGHAALFELLSEQGLARGRSLIEADRLSTDDAMWWIEPRTVCDARIAKTGEVDVLDPDAVQWTARDWIESGGTALVLLEPEGPGRVVCDAIAGTALPARSAVEASRVDGFGAAPSRDLGSTELSVFDTALDWDVAATVAGRPFVLERALGSGRLLVVSDASFARNEGLDRADAAVFAVDLARETGPLRIDETEHGFVKEIDTASYLMRSQAAPVFVALAGVGLLVLWRGAALPVRDLADDRMASPTLARFVASMARHYRRTGDHERAAQRYRAAITDRLRRMLALPVGSSPEQLAEALERRGVPARALREARAVRTATELRAEAARLDQLVEEVRRR